MDKTQDINIHLPVDDSGRYNVAWKNRSLGYLFIAGTDSKTGSPIWKGSTTGLDVIAGQLGSSIEKAQFVKS